MTIPPHGGDIYDYDRPLLDFSANINPFGMPEEVAMAAREAVADCHRYPDPQCRELRRAIGQMESVPPGWVFCGNGAADVIFRLILACRPKRAMVTAPTFSEYEKALETSDCQVNHWILFPEHDFLVKEDILDAIQPGLDMLFLCSPNNPTGMIVPPDRMKRILSRCTKTNTRLVVDECFLSLSDGVPLTRELENHPNLILLRAFTKSYAIPGLRLGYGLSSDEALLRRCGECGQPWGVSSVAQAAGIAACACPDWPKQTRDFLRQERPRLKSGLEALGLRVWQGQANFLLFQAKNDIYLKNRMLEKGILIRSCANYIGLGPDYYRVAVRKSQENDILLQVLKEVLPWQKQL